MDEIFVFFLFMGRKQASKQPEIRNRRKVRKTLPEDEEKTVSPSLSTTSTSEAGRRGGSAVRDKYGEEYYRRIGKKGGAALKEKRGNEYYRTIAQKGGQANVSKYGSDHFSQMGKKGGNTTKQRHDPDFYSRIGRMGGSAKRQKKIEKDATM